MKQRCFTKRQSQYHCCRRLLKATSFMESPDRSTDVDKHQQRASDDIRSILPKQSSSLSSSPLLLEVCYCLYTKDTTKRTSKLILYSVYFRFFHHLHTPSYPTSQDFKANLCSHKRSLLSNPIIRRGNFHNVCSNDIQTF